MSALPVTGELFATNQIRAILFNHNSICAMPTTQQAAITLEDYWRSVILQGANVASYKFALANRCCN